MKCLVYFAAIGLVACSTPDRYYKLSAPSVPETRAVGLPTGIGPVTIPAYIDRPELVFESENGELRVPAGHRWSGSIKEEITRVITIGVQAQKRKSGVLAYPWPPGVELARHIPITITELTARSGVGVRLSATWEVGATQRRVTIHQEIHGDGYAAIISAQSAALEQLAQRIASSY